MKTEIKKLREIISDYFGTIPVQLRIVDKSEKVSIIKLPQSVLITPSENLLRELENMFGEGNIKLLCKKI